MTVCIDCRQEVRLCGIGNHWHHVDRPAVAHFPTVIAERFQCPACGHWCVAVDDGGWICSKRGGCGAEWTYGGYGGDS